MWHVTYDACCLMVIYLLIKAIQIHNTLCCTIRTIEHPDCCHEARILCSVHMPANDPISCGGTEGKGGCYFMRLGHQGKMVVKDDAHSIGKSTN